MFGGVLLPLSRPNPRRSVPPHRVPQLVMTAEKKKRGEEGGGAPGAAIFSSLRGGLPLRLRLRVANKMSF